MAEPTNTPILPTPADHERVMQITERVRTALRGSNVDEALVALLGTTVVVINQLHPREAMGMAIYIENLAAQIRALNGPASGSA